MKKRNKINRVYRISRLFKKMANNLGNIDYFLQGENLSGMESKYPGYVKALVEANEILQNLKIDRFVGSGAVGDAWLLENGTVFKIFDNNMKNELDKYKQIHDMLFSADKKDRDKAKFEVMIYDFGTLNEPSSADLRGLEPYRINIPRNKSFKRWDMREGMDPVYWPAYVVLESVETVDDRAQKYLPESSENFPYEDTAENNLVRSYYLRMPDPLKKRFEARDPFIGKLGFPKWFEDYYRIEEKIKDYSSDYLVNYYVEKVINLTIMITADEFKREVSKLPFPEDLHDTSQLRSGMSAISEWTRDLHSAFKLGFFNGTVPFENYQIIQELLGLGDNWLKDLIYLTMDKLAKGQKDVHMGNLGFRRTTDSPFIYFDA